MLTAEQLQSIMPRLSDARNSEFLPFLAAAMAEFAIEAPARAAAFLAQLAHESGQFRFMEEIWGPTDAQRRYEQSRSCRRPWQYQRRRRQAIQGARSDSTDRTRQLSALRRSPQRRSPGGSA
jgi:predicted chitinase